MRDPVGGGEAQARPARPALGRFEDAERFVSDAAKRELVALRETGFNVYRAIVAALLDALKLLLLSLGPEEEGGMVPLARALPFGRGPP